MEPLFNKGKKLLSRLWVLSKYTKHGTGNSSTARLLHPSHNHTHVPKIATETSTSPLITIHMCLKIAIETSITAPNHTPKKLATLNPDNQYSDPSGYECRKSATKIN